MDQERYARGLQALKDIDGEAGETVVARLAQSPDIGQDVAEMLVGFAFGEVYSRPLLPRRDKEIAVIAALAAMGYPLPQLKVHIRAALNVGVTREEIKEIFVLMALYAGFPAMLNALLAMEEVFGQVDATG